VKPISIRYFALLREEAGKDFEEISTEAMTYGDVYQNLQGKYQFTLPVSMIRVAVNDEFCRMNDQVLAGAKIVFIPPVAGG
jgi:molybdopterin synthase sulfur carrier subunit